MDSINKHGAWIVCTVPVEPAVLESSCQELKKHQYSMCHPGSASARGQNTCSSTCEGPAFEMGMLTLDGVVTIRSQRAPPGISFYFLFLRRSIALSSRAILAWNSSLPVHSWCRCSSSAASPRRATTSSPMRRRAAASAHLLELEPHPWRWRSPPSAMVAHKTG